MPDSTRETPPSGRSRRGRRGDARSWVGFGLACLLALLTVPAGALADGDPASDVLAAQTLFLPQDAGMSGTTAQRLAGEIAAGAAARPLRVAIVASPADLGAVTALWHRPQAYARFLGQEIALVAHGEVLVVMPNGYGVASDGRSAPSADAALIARLPAPGRAVVAGALHAVIGLNRAHGVSASISTRVAPGGGGGAGVMAWVVFAVGLVLIAGAWTLSLRARRLATGRR